MLIQLEDATLGYDGKPILSVESLRIAPGARIGVLGANGAGKTTLMRTLAGDLAAAVGRSVSRPAQQRRLFRAASARIAAGRTQRAGDTCGCATPNATDQRRRTYLGGWGFAGDMAMRPTASLSGGEKARLVLALIAWQQPALLLLDEPTNHLDIEMRHALTRGAAGVRRRDGHRLARSRSARPLRRRVLAGWRAGTSIRTPDDLEQYAERIRQRVAPVATRRRTEPARASPGVGRASPSDTERCARRSSGWSRASKR